MLCYVMLWLYLCIQVRPGPPKRTSGFLQAARMTFLSSSQQYQSTEQTLKH